MSLLTKRRTVQTIGSDRDRNQKEKYNREKHIKLCWIQFFHLQRIYEQTHTQKTKRMQKGKILVFTHRKVYWWLITDHPSNRFPIIISYFKLKEQGVKLFIRRHHRPITTVFNQVLLQVTPSALHHRITLQTSVTDLADLLTPSMRPTTIVILKNHQHATSHYIIIQNAYCIQIHHVHITIAHITLRFLVYWKIEEIVHILALLINDLNKRLAWEAIHHASVQAVPTNSGCFGSSTWCAYPHDVGLCQYPKYNQDSDALSSEHKHPNRRTSSWNLWELA